MNEDIIGGILMWADNNGLIIKTLYHKDLNYKFSSSFDKMVWNEKTNVNLEFGVGNSMQESIVNLMRRHSGENAYYYYYDSNNEKFKKSIVMPVIII